LRGHLVPRNQPTSLRHVKHDPQLGSLRLSGPWNAAIAYVRPGLTKKAPRDALTIPCSRPSHKFDCLSQGPGVAAAKSSARSVSITTRR
jgi:hypothetical protein